MTKQLFEKILIANRGEIALRIMQTAKKMGIKTVAVYSEADTNANHVKFAEEAYYIGNSPATESYLSIKNIISAIRASGAQAVHPGYGFLAENTNFALALKREGITLIGPSANAIKQMGDKIEAKKIAINAGINTVPGYIGSINSPDQAIKIASEIGFPVIVKAAAGGGGRGMRVVNNSDEMRAAYDSAKLEAASSFSDARVFIEKLIKKPRHIEIQILADQYGNIVCLGERECSIQRNHQKVIEEAPSNFIDEETRNKMYTQSIALAKKVDYYSAGTIEFMMDNDKHFYFLEMNTRIQVEHPVTELITGIDIVEEMIKIAAGHSLSFKQEDVKLNGCAIECRICSEDPLRGFLPSSGRIVEYKEPPKSSHTNIHSSVSAGAEVSMFYDSMIAKLCTHDKTREQAIERMKEALGSFVIRGIAHNISFLEAIMNNQRFMEGKINTNFIREEYPDGFLGANLTSENTEVFVAVGMHIFMSEQKRYASIQNQIIDQVNKLGTRWVISIDDQSFPVLITNVHDGYNIRQGLTRIYIRSSWNLGGRLFTGQVNRKKINVKVEYIRTGYLLTFSGITVQVYIRSPRVSELEALMPKKTLHEVSKEFKAPLNGKILSIKVAEGDEVEKGQELLILSAMKMENTITAQNKGKIKSILVKEHDHVNYGQILLEME